MDVVSHSRSRSERRLKAVVRRSSPNPGNGCLGIIDDLDVPAEQSVSVTAFTDAGIEALRELGAEAKRQSGGTGSAGEKGEAAAQFEQEAGDVLWVRARSRSRSWAFSARPGKSRIYGSLSASRARSDCGGGNRSAKLVMALPARLVGGRLDLHGQHAARPALLERLFRIPQPLGVVVELV
jgi:hypothetical protein